MKNIKKSNSNENEAVWWFNHEVLVYIIF
jgi:hypothetical protein